MASAAGLNQSQLSRILNDTQNLEYGTFMRVVESFGLDRARALAAYEETRRLIAAARGQVGPKAVRATSQLRRTALRQPPPKR